MENHGYIGSTSINEEIIFLDFLEELDPYIDRFSKNRIRGVKFISCSPFRADSSPSFAINLDNGLWVDSGATDDHFKKGNFISLISKLSNDDYAEVKADLLNKYSTTKREVAGLSLSMNLTPIEKEEAVIELDYKFSPYLAGRGISAETQELYGSSESDGAIALAWKNPKGGIINIKYRCTEDKVFWYNSIGKSIRNYLYGMNIAKDKSIVWIVESEIDAMYLHTAGYWAVAIGRASVTDIQIQTLINSRIEEIVIAVDNDKVGKLLKGVLVDCFKPYFTLSTLSFPETAKDINDCTITQLHTMYTERTTTQALSFRLNIKDY